MNNMIQTRVNEVLSKLYKQPVVAGFTNSGWAVVKSAADSEIVIDGGLGKPVAPLTAEILDSMCNLTGLLDDLERALDTEESILE